MQNINPPARASPFVFGAYQPNNSTKKEVKEKMTGASQYGQNPHFITDCYNAKFSDYEQNPRNHFFP